MQGRRRSVFAGVGGMVATPRGKAATAAAAKGSPSRAGARSPDGEARRVEQEDRQSHPQQVNEEHTQRLQQSQQSPGARQQDSPSELEAEEKFKSGPHEVDWSSFPLFPLEQLAFLGHVDLTRTRDALDDLVQSMGEAADPTEAALANYARREQQEIARRLEALEASARVSHLLHSTSVPAIAELRVIDHTQLTAVSPNRGLAGETTRRKPPSPQAKPQESRGAPEHLDKRVEDQLAVSRSSHIDKQQESMRGADTAQSQEQDCASERASRESSSYMAAKKMSQAARRATISNAKTFVVFSESSRREKRLQQESQRERMLARARAKAKKKRRQEKRQHLEKLREARAKLKEREESRARWEQERQERVARAEALAKEMRQRSSVDSGLASARSLRNSAPSAPESSTITGGRRGPQDLPSHGHEPSPSAAICAEEEEEDEDVIALEEAIEEEKAASEDVRDRQRILLEVEQDSNDAKDEATDDDEATNDDEMDSSNETEDHEVGEKPSQARAHDDAEVEDTPDATVSESASAGDARSPAARACICPDNQDERGEGSSIINEQTTDSAANVGRSRDAETKLRRVYGLGSIGTSAQASLKLSHLSPTSPPSAADYGFMLSPISPTRLEQISPVSGIANDEDLSTPCLETQSLREEKSPRVSKPARARAARRHGKGRAAIFRQPPAAQRSADSSFTQKKSLLDKLKQDMAAVRQDMKVDLSAIADGIGDDDIDDMMEAAGKSSGKSQLKSIDPAPHSQSVSLKLIDATWSAESSPGPAAESSSSASATVQSPVNLAPASAEERVDENAETAAARCAERKDDELASNKASATPEFPADSAVIASLASSETEAAASPCPKATFSACQRVLGGLGGFSVSYADHFASFGDIFTAFASQDARKSNKAQVLESVLGQTIETYMQTNRALALELCDDDDEQYLEVGASRFFRVLSKSRHEVFNIVRDAGLSLDTLGVEDSVSLVESKLREGAAVGAAAALVHTARTPMALLPQWAGPVWNLLWTWSKPKVDRDTLLRWQRVNHFSSARSLTRKDLLKKELQRYRSMSKFLSQEFELLPDTFILPKEYLQFVDAFAKYGEMYPDGNYWIMKPVGLSRGRGISLVSDIGDVCYGQSVIIQRYVRNPMLLDGYKFDLRIYVLVTSFNPLEAWIYDEGFVRVCTHKYSSAAIDIHNLFIHLTNSSIQKMGPNGAGTKATAESISRHQAEIDEAGGTKLSLSYLWRRLRAKGLDVEVIQTSIRMLILKSLVCCDESMAHEPNSFELFGYDVLLDEDLRPWLIEINSSPSLAQENQLDSKIKRTLIADTLRLVNPIGFDRSVLLEVLRRRQDEMEQNRMRPFKQTAASRESERERLDRELTAIFRGRRPRGLGEQPEETGGFALLCPNTAEHEAVRRIMRQERGPKTSKRTGARSGSVSTAGPGVRGLEYLAEGCNVKL